MLMLSFTQHALALRTRRVPMRLVNLQVTRSDADSNQ